MDFSAAWATIECQIIGLLASLPNLGIAAIVFFLCYLAGKEIKRQLVAHGIDIPFPTQQILFHTQTDGDRARPREG